MGAHYCLNNFTGGEISPQLDARIDLQKYQTSCQTMQNFRALPWGGATFRSGTLHICETKDSNLPFRLMPFNFSTGVSYGLEWGDGYLRFVRDGAQILSGGLPYEVSTPYSYTQVFELQAKEINDIMYLTHPSIPRQKLSRLGETNWTMESVVDDYPPLLDESADAAKTLAPSAVTGSGIDLVANFDAFTADNVGSYFELKHFRDSNSVTCDISVTAGTETSASIRVQGPWTVTTTERWWGKLDVERSTDGGTTWVKIGTSESIAGNRNINNSGVQETDALFRLFFTSGGDPYASPPWVGTAPTAYVKATAVFEAQSAYIAGLVLVTAVTDEQNAVADVIIDLEATTPTSVWSEGAWSDRRGFPRTLGFYEQRVLYAGTTHKPNTTWGSRSGDFENFKKGDLETDSIVYQFAATQQNPIQWLSSLTFINAGSSGGEFAMSSGTSGEPLSPANVAVRGTTNFGSAYHPALQIDEAIMFIQRQGKRIMAMQEKSPYVNQDIGQAIDLTLMAEHITESGVVQMDYARLPDPQLAVVTNEGLAILTYNRAQNISAWARYVTDGQIETVACVYGTPSDVVYVGVKRFINGRIVRFIEAFTAPQADAIQSVYMDCAATYNGSGTTIMTGLDHLEGEAVAVVADGKVIGNAFTGDGVLTVVGGQITLPYAASVIRVGLAYFGQLKPMKLDIQTGSGPSQGKKKRISELTVRFKDTLGGWVGNSDIQDIETNQFAQEIPFASTDDQMDTAVPLFTGEIPTPWAVGTEDHAEIVVSQLQPLPMTVLGLFASFDVFGN